MNNIILDTKGRQVADKLGYTVSNPMYVLDTVRAGRIVKSTVLMTLEEVQQKYNMLTGMKNCKLQIREVITLENLN